MNFSMPFLDWITMSVYSEVAGINFGYYSPTVATSGSTAVSMKGYARLHARVENMVKTCSGGICQNADRLQDRQSLFSRLLS